MGILERESIGGFFRTVREEILWIPGWFPVRNVIKGDVAAQQGCVPEKGWP